VPRACTVCTLPESLGINEGLVVEKRSNCAIASQSIMWQLAAGRLGSLRG
jgi:hypothetical protein